MKKTVNRVYIDLSISRNKEEYIVPNRFLYIKSCPTDVYISFNDRDDELLNLKEIKHIDLAGVSKIYITNSSYSGTAELLFTSLLKIEFAS